MCESCGVNKALGNSVSVPVQPAESKSNNLMFNVR